MHDVWLLGGYRPMEATRPETGAQMTVTAIPAEHVGNSIAEHFRIPMKSLDQRDVAAGLCDRFAPTCERPITLEKRFRLRQIICVGIVDYHNSDTMRHGLSDARHLMRMALVVSGGVDR